MNNSLQNILSEVVGANNIAYLLHEKGSFSETGYKVLQNYKSGGLLKCAKLHYNGRIKLVYIIGDLKPLSYVATRLGVNELTIVIRNMIQRIQEIRAHGFFQLENLELDFNKIFVDTTNDTVSFVYFPVSGGLSGNLSDFENDFRAAMIRLFNSFPVFGAPHFQRLSSELSYGPIPLEQILQKLQEVVPVPPRPRHGPGPGPGPIPSPGPKSDPNIPQPPMLISAINAPIPVALQVNKPEYVLGRQREKVDGLISYNPTVGRTHCKITYRNGRYYLTDLGSHNGTFLNQQKLPGYQAVELHSGDYITLANSDFVISF